MEDKVVVLVGMVYTFSGDYAGVYGVMNEDGSMTDEIFYYDEGSGIFAVEVDGLNIMPLQDSEVNTTVLRKIIESTARGTVYGVLAVRDGLCMVRDLDTFESVIQGLRYDGTEVEVKGYRDVGLIEAEDNPELYEFLAETILN